MVSVCVLYVRLDGATFGMLIAIILALALALALALYPQQDTDSG